MGYVTKCSNNAQISGQNFVGGIVGYNLGGHIDYCYNNATITGSEQYIGGIAGHTQEYNGDSIKLCYNVGSVTGNGCVGGIVGSAWSGNGNVVKISHLYNTGNVTVKQNTATVGGILGATYQNLTGSSENNRNSINYSYNIGNVNGSMASQIAGGYFNYTNTYFIAGRTNKTGLGISKDSSLFKAPLSNTNSVYYGLNQGGANIWTINGNNNGNVSFIWQTNKTW